MIDSFQFGYRDICKQYRHKPVLTDISFTIGNSDCFIITGEIENTGRHREAGQCQYYYQSGPGKILAKLPRPPVTVGDVSPPAALYVKR